MTDGARAGFRLNRHKLRALRLKSLRRQEDLAREAGVSVGSVSRLEGGWHPSPHLATVRKLATVPGCEPSDLLVWSDDVEAHAPEEKES